MKRAVRGWWLVLGAVVACRRSAPATETTTVSDPPPAQTASARPPGCDAPREGESLAEFDARCRGGLQAAGSDCDVPKEDESFDAFQQRCARRARARGAGRPTMPTAPTVPGVGDAGAVVTAMPDAALQEFSATFRFSQSLSLRVADVASLDRVRARLQDEIAACATQVAARGESVPGVVQVRYTVAGRRFAVVTAGFPAPPPLAQCIARVFRATELPSEVNGDGTLMVMLREK